MLAESKDGERILATPNAMGICPFCKSEVIPKCGEIITWHWAHKSLKQCDAWGEPESEWHYGWKKAAGLENTEITIEKNGKKHRADIIIRGKVIELQHSPIPTKMVREREEFYGNMMWIVDGSTTLLKRSKYPIERWKSKRGKFYYKWTGLTRAWVNEITKPLYIHFDELLIYTYHWHVYDRNGEAAYLKTPDDSKPIFMRDALVLVDGEYCNIYNVDAAIKYFFRGGKE